MSVLSDIGWLVVLAAVLTLVSGFLSAIDVALLSLSRVDREQMARSDKPRDKVVLRLLERPRRLTATVQVCNEAVNAGLAVVVLAAMELELPHASVLVCAGIALAVALTLVVLVGEVLPRTLAQASPMAWSRRTARPLQLLWVVAAPVRWLVTGTADLLLRPFGIAGRQRPRDLSEEEFKTLVDAGSAQGQVDQRERRLIHRVFEFGDKNVGQIMTPRDRVFALSYDLPMARLVKEVAARGFSRVPIYQRSMDNVRGILNAKDLVLAATGQSPARALGDLLHDALFVPRTTPVKRLFRIFKQKKVHMALVVNEYGKLLGVVTMDDVLEQLFGDIRDEREPLQAAARRVRSQHRTPVPGAETGQVMRIEPEAVDAPAAAAPSEPPAEPPADDAAPSPVRPAGSAPPGDADDSVPVPIADVVTGPSGPVARPRSGGER